MSRIALCGPQCSGKTLICSIIMDATDKYIDVYKFADPIYDTLSVLGQRKNRLFMQEFSDLTKKHFGKNIFIDLFVDELKLFNLQDILCDDVRYLEELNIVHQHNFISIYVDADEDIRRARAEEQNLLYNDEHNSEKVEVLKDFCHYYILNNGSKDFLTTKIERILKDARE